MLQSGDTLQQLIQSLWPESTCALLPTAHQGKRCIYTNRLDRALDNLTQPVLSLNTLPTLVNTGVWIINVAFEQVF